MNPILLQKQLKENNKDLVDFCQDLKSWGDEMKRKEDMLNPNKKQEPSTKLNKTSYNENKKSKSIQENKAAQTACKTYADWEKFNAEAECERIEKSDSESELTDEFDESVRDEAIVEKEKGNKFVKIQKWDEAIASYTKAIDCYSCDPVFYANRALCHLKKEDYLKAEKDCTMSLKLDNGYVKAYQRRAAARESLNKLEESRLDLLKVLEIEPKNTETKAALEKLQKKLITEQKPVPSETNRRPLSKFTASRNPNSAIKVTSQQPVSRQQNDSPTSSKCQNTYVDTKKPNVVWPSGDLDIVTIKAVKKPPHMRSKKPLKRIEIKDMTALKHQGDNSRENNELVSSWPRADSQSSSIKSDDFKVIERKQSKNNKTEIYSTKIAEIKHNISKESNASNGSSETKKESNNQYITARISSSKIEELKTNTIVETDATEGISLSVPRTAVQFYTTWRHLKGNEVKYHYLKLIEPNQIPNLFKESLESNIFSELLSILADFGIKNNDSVYYYLLNLAKVKRFSAISMFMTLNDKNCLWKLFNFIKQYEKQPKEDIDNLIKRYEL